MRYVSHQRHFGHFDLHQSVILVTSANSEKQDKFCGPDQSKGSEQRSTFHSRCSEPSVYL